MQLDSSHRAGGYFLAKTVSRPDWLPHTFPIRILSASSCMVDMLPDSLEIPLWASRGKSKWEDKPLVNPTRFQEMLAWADEKWDLHEIEWGSLFRSADLAKAFVALFELSTDNMILVGIALPEKYVHFLEEDESSKGCGVNKMIQERLTLEPGAKLIGYEVLGWEAPNFHSWLCYHFFDYALENLGIRPNNQGFIDRLDEAERLADYARRTDLPSEKTVPMETQPWLPWLIALYPLR